MLLLLYGPKQASKNPHHAMRMHQALILILQNGILHMQGLISMHRTSHH